MTGVPMWREIQKDQRYSQERSPYEDRGRDWSYTQQNKGCQGFQQSTETKQGKKRFFPTAFRESMDLPMP